MYQGDVGRHRVLEQLQVAAALVYMPPTYRPSPATHYTHYAHIPLPTTHCPLLSTYASADR